MALVTDEMREADARLARGRGFKFIGLEDTDALLRLLDQARAASEVPRPARREADLSPRTEDTSPNIIPVTTVKGETL